MKLGWIAKRFCNFHFVEILSRERKPEIFNVSRVQSSAVYIHEDDVMCKLIFCIGFSTSTLSTRSFTRSWYTVRGIWNSLYLGKINCGKRMASVFYQFRNLKNCTCLNISLSAPKQFWHSLIHSLFRWLNVWRKTGHWPQSFCLTQWHGSDLQIRCHNLVFLCRMQSMVCGDNEVIKSIGPGCSPGICPQICSSTLVI